MSSVTPGLWRLSSWRCCSSAGIAALASNVTPARAIAAAGYGRVRGMHHQPPQGERPTPAVHFEAEPIPPGIDGDGLEPMPAADLSAQAFDAARATAEARRELETVAASIASLRAHARRVELAHAAERLAAVVSALPMVDIWQITRVVADALGGPQGESFEAALLDLLRAAREARP